VLPFRHQRADRLAATMLGLGSRGFGVVPELAISEYDVGRRLGTGAGCSLERFAHPLGPAPAMLYVKSASQPDRSGLGVRSPAQAGRGWARERGVVVASDECYLGLGWDAQPLSVLILGLRRDDHRSLAVAYRCPSLLRWQVTGRFRAADAAVSVSAAGDKHAGG